MPYDLIGTKTLGDLRNQVERALALWGPDARVNRSPVGEINVFSPDAETWFGTIEVNGKGVDTWHPDDVCPACWTRVVEWFALQGADPYQAEKD